MKYRNAIYIYTSPNTEKILHVLSKKGESTETEEYYFRRAVYEEQKEMIAEYGYEMLQHLDQGVHLYPFYAKSYITVTEGRVESFYPEEVSSEFHLRKC